MKPRNALSLLLALSACSSTEPVASTSGAGAVEAISALAPAADPGRLTADVAWLADDAREGRRAGTAGGHAAATWIAERLRSLGLEPAGADGDFLQPFQVPLPVRDGGNSRVLWGAGEILGADRVVPLFCSDGDHTEGPLAWRGYGLVDEERGRDDYAAGSVEGAVVLLVRGAPPVPEESGEPAEEGDADDDDTALVQHGSGWGNAATLFTKVMNAKRRGAVAVLIAEHPGSEAPMMTFDVSRSAQAGVPALFLSADAVRQLVDSYDALVEAEDAGTGRGEPGPENERIAVSADVRREKGLAHNVLGRLPGRNRGRSVVIGAHFDHLGRGGDGSLAPDRQGEVHNGADDNASGTAAVLEMARLLAAGPEPGGDVVFALWDGEELGLLGSEYWGKNPTVPLEDVAANLNLDMVGRAGDGALTVLGAGTAEPLGAWLEQAGATAGIELSINRSGAGVGGSDHQTFLKREIPAVHLFTGIHEDYHRPSDDTERFEAGGAARVVELGVALVALVQSEESLAFVAVEADEEEQARVRGGWRVWFGTVPEYSYEGVGLLLGGTSSGSPAEKAGLLKGDVLLQVGEVEIENIYDFMHALQIYKPGDVVLTRYDRDGEEREVRVTLASSGAQ